MIEPAALTELEHRVRAMDALQPSLDRLRQTIELIAGAVVTEVKISIEPTTLRVRRGHAEWGVRLEENAYHYSYMHQADTWDGRERSTSKLAWDIVGHPKVMERIKILATAAAKREVAKLGRGGEPSRPTKTKP